MKRHNAGVARLNEIFGYDSAVDSTEKFPFPNRQTRRAKNRVAKASRKRNRNGQAS